MPFELFGRPFRPFQYGLNNLIAAESSIRDVDMAREYSEAVRKEVSLKASMAMLAHQQQVPNLVLSFLNR